MNFILASASERRKELLSRLISNYKVIVSDFDESSVNFNGDVEHYVKTLALGKAKAVEQLVNNEAIIIAADTIVVLDDKILGKPKDKRDAFNMLKSLSGKSHKVYTGMAIINVTKSSYLVDSVCTKVKFSEISDNEILQYIDSGEPMDKAGAYGIQGCGGIFVEKINGCYYNIVGLPINKLKRILNKFDVGEKS